MIISGGIGQVGQIDGLGQICHGLVQEGRVSGQESVQVVGAERGDGGGSLGRAQVGIVESRRSITVGRDLGLGRGLC